MRMRVAKFAIGAGILAVSLGVFASQAAAANCGGVNQKACKVWERVPSCDKGLTELVKPGFCSKPPAIVSPKVFDCGALGQKPCALVVRVPSCDSGLVEDFVRNQCVQKSNADSLAELGKACYKNLETVSLAMAPLATCLSRLPDPKGLLGAFEKKDVRSVVEHLVFGSCQREVEQTAAVLRQNGLASMSLGLSGEVGTLVGATAEFFLAVNTNLQGTPHIYETLGYKFGKFTGGSLNGVATAHRANANNLDGDGQAISLSFKALGGAGFSAGFSYANGSQSPNCSSLSIAAGKGVEINAGSINRFTTIRLTR